MKDIKDNFLTCVDCNEEKDVMFTKDFFMVNDKLWNKFGSGDDYVCLRCFEKRIGRKLKSSDLTLVKLNLLHNPYTMRILGVPQEQIELIKRMRADYLHEVEEE